MTTVPPRTAEADGSLPSDRAPRAEAPAWTPWRAALSGLCAMLVGIGLARFAYAPIIPALVEGGWFSAGQAAYLGAINLAGYLLGAVIATRLERRWSALSVLRAAMVAAAVALAACALPFGFAWVGAWRLVAGVAGAVLMVLAAPTVLARTPVGRRGRVAGIVFTGIALGIMLSGVLVPWLAERGVVATWLGLAGLAAALTALGWRGWPAAAARAPERGAPRPGRLGGGAALAMLAGAYGLDAVGYVPHTVFVVDFVSRGLERGLAVGGAYWAVLGLGAAGGPMIAGWAAERWGFGRVFAAALAVKAAAVATPLVATGPVPLGLSCAIVGALAPAAVSLASGRVLDVFGPERQKRMWGVMTASFAICQAAAGFGMSALFDATGSYLPLFAVGAVALILASGLAASAGRGRAVAGTGDG